VAIKQTRYIHKSASIGLTELGTVSTGCSLEGEEND